MKTTEKRLVQLWVWRDFLRQIVYAKAFLENAAGFSKLTCVRWMYDKNTAAVQKEVQWIFGRTFKRKSAKRGKSKMYLRETVSFKGETRLCETLWFFPLLRRPRFSRESRARFPNVQNYVIVGVRSSYRSKRCGAFMFAASMLWVRRRIFKTVYARRLTFTPS